VRLSDADREQLAAALGRHYVEGRLNADELNHRLDTVYRARLHADAAATLADLPPSTASPSPRRRRRWSLRHGEADGPEPGWVPTTERFRDPSTRRLMRVWIDPVSATRHYLTDELR